MRLTPLGKLLLFILVAGGAIGAWRLWQRSPGAPQVSVPKVPGLGGLLKPGSKTGGGSAPVAEDGSVVIPFVITAAKKDWVKDQIERFNAANQGKYRIEEKPVPSREAMHAILSGKEQPVLWSPGSPIWPNRLAEAWAESHGGQQLLDMTDPNAYRVFLRSPLVVLTTKEKAAFLRPLLSGPKPWSALREASMGRRKAPWGRLRFSHADPLTSSSGMLTLALILNEYAAETGRLGELEQVANDRRFITWMKELETGLVYDEPAEKGTTALTKAYIEDPSRYDFITAYESAALEAAPKNPELAVLYPSPTAVSEHAVSLLSGDWVSEKQRAGAAAFLQFLGGKEAIQEGIRYYFRPASPSGSLSLSDAIGRVSSQGFQQTYTTAELPRYEALNSAAFQWRVYVAKKPPASAERK